MQANIAELSDKLWLHNIRLN